MKLKTLSFIAGAIALTLTAAPFAVQAQTASTSPLIVAEGAKKGPWQNLNLSDAQKTRIREIRRDTRTKIEGILTPEQKAKLQAESQNGQRGQRRGPGKDFRALNLSTEQKAQIRQIMQSSKQQIDEVLTPEQRQQIQQARQDRANRRQQQKPQ
jgi:Spy/CpxP family protein refolding chaperone